MTAYNTAINELIEQELQNNPLLEREDEYLAETQETSIPTIDDLNNEPLNQYQEATIENDSDYQNDFDDFHNTLLFYNTKNLINHPLYLKANHLPLFLQ